MSDVELGGPQGAPLVGVVMGSKSDLPLMERVAEPIAVNPDPRLRRIAERRRWRIERW